MLYSSRLEIEIFRGDHTVPDTTPYREARRVELAVNPAVSDV